MQGRETVALERSLPRSPQTGKCFCGHPASGCKQGGAPHAGTYQRRVGQAGGVGGGGAPPRREPGGGTKRARTGDPMPEATVRPKHGRRLRFLLLYAGRARRPLVRVVASRVTRARGQAIVINEVDPMKTRFRTKKRGPNMAPLTNAVPKGDRDLVIAIPPASTFSRARLRAGAGPPSVRQTGHVYGLTNLRGGHREGVCSETS